MTLCQKSLKPRVAGGLSALRRPLTLIVTILLLGCAPGDKLSTYRYRLMVTVVTPEGPRSGTSVIEVRTRKVAGKWVLPQARGYPTEVSGDAVIVDLGRRGLLVALLRAPFYEAWPSYVMSSALPPETFRPEAGGADSHEHILSAILASRKPLIVPHWDGPTGNTSDNYPDMLRVTGPDLAEVLPVDHDRLDAAFGPGVFLKRITVQRTDAPVTGGIADRLPWLRRPEEEVSAFFRGNPATHDLGLGKRLFTRSE